MSRGLRRAIFVAGIIMLVLLLAYAGISLELYSSRGGFSTEGARYPAPRINELIWPTIGYPALITPGAFLEAELDLCDYSDGERQPEEVSYFRAVIEPVREELSGISYQLNPTRAWKAASGRWLRGTGGPESADVWHVQFQVPHDVVPELYDLSVEARVSGRAVSDSQPHSVGVMEERGDNFSFISLADIHVHRRNISGWMQPQSNEGIAPDGRPIFFENAIDQVNLIRPDFVVMLGDFVRAQHSEGDYQIEFEWFYRELSRFQVPVFAVPGNHDQYVNQVDGARVWEENLGPLYYSFDVGNCHFTCLNTYQWPLEDRIVMKKLGLFVFPRKWQGQVLEARDESDVTTYSGELAWIRDDLASRRGSPLKVVFLHHDPFRPDGRGISFDSEKFALIFSFGGGGMGKTALKELASRYSVDMVFSGHLHSDYVGRAPWADLKGETVYAGQTCVYFDEGGTRDKYPGYRLVKVVDGKVRQFSYLDGFHSFPIYDGSVIDGKTDLDHLERQALKARGSRQSGAGAAPAWEVENYLGVEMELKGLVAIARGPHGVSGVLNGEVYRVVELPGEPERVLLYVKTIAPRGVPGKKATEPGTPSKLEVTVSPVSSTGARLQQEAQPVGVAD